MIDAIFISNLFPNPAEPGRGLYNRDQMVALAHQGLKFHVISPLPWFPFVNPWKQAIPRHTTMDGIPVTYCRQLYLPGSRGAQNGYLYALSIRRTLSRLIRQHHPTFLWSSFAFPDGVGVAVEARRHGIPHVTSLLGSDINLNHHYPSRWKTITKSLRQACLIFAKSKALRERVEDSFPPSALPPPPPIHIDYNGVDQDLFRPASREGACRQLGLDPSTKHILFVGNLVPVKDVATLIRAFARISSKVGSRKSEVGELHASHSPPTSDLMPPTSGIQLIIIGAGPEETSLRRLANDLGHPTSDIRHPTSDLLFASRQPRETVALWMQACDCLCLPSLNEGVPNVILEAMACGLPVVASRVGGIPEIHSGASCGELFKASDVPDLSRSLGIVLAKEWDSDKIREQVKHFTWRHNAESVLDRLKKLDLHTTTIDGP